MEKLKTIKRLSLGALFATGALALSGCSDYNTEGKGNDFTVDAKITSVGKRSIHAEVVRVEAAEGKATEWFDGEGVHQIHDNYSKCEFFGGMHTVGTVYDPRGHEEGLGNIKPGETVKIVGKIRESAEACGKVVDYDFRPVFDSMQESGN